MRQGHSINNNNNNKRMRGRNRKGPSPMARSYESNGPDVKIRGTAIHVAEKYVMLARDAASSSDRVAEQSYLQHAEHYYRIVAAAQAQMPQSMPFQRPDEDGDDEGDEQGGGPYDRPMQAGGGERQPSFGAADPQPYVNGAPFNGHREAIDAGGDVDDGEGDFDDRAGQGGGGRIAPPVGAPPPDRGGPNDRPHADRTGAPDQGGDQHFRGRGRRSGRGRPRPPQPNQPAQPQQGEFAPPGESARLPVVEE